MELEKAIDELKRKYEHAKTMEYINKPLAYAFYETWKMVDRKEKLRKKFGCD